MSQLSLFALPQPVAASVLWCRPALGCLGSFVIGLPSPAPAAALLWLSQSCSVQSVAPLAGGVAVLVAVPASLSSAFWSLPSPRGGSRHPSNLLPF